MTMAPRRLLTLLSVSVPPEAAEEFERIAVIEGRNNSELFREMLRVYRACRERDDLRRSSDIALLGRPSLEFVTSGM
jgi:hypothetical protein